MDLFEVPGTAIHAFEKIHRLRITVHDLLGVLWPFLPPERFQHHDARCQAVKVAGFNQRCVDFEVEKLRIELPNHLTGRAHVCHAGYVEWVVPVFGRRGELEIVLFAGIRSPGKSFRAATQQAPSRELINPRPSRSLALPVVRSNAPPTVDEETSQAILENLRQLAARLKAWMTDYRGTISNAPDSSSDAHRRTSIRAFVVHRHRQPVRLKDLADMLGLTESRTSHVVQSLFGRTFRQMLTEARLRTAMGLLRHFSMPVSDVASRSGFDDLRHFHRLFKRETGDTPYKYRQKMG